MDLRQIVSLTHFDGGHVGVLDVEGRALRLERVQPRRFAGVELLRLEVVVAEHLERGEGSLFSEIPFMMILAFSVMKEPDVLHLLSISLDGHVIPDTKRRLPGIKCAKLLGQQIR